MKTLETLPRFRFKLVELGVQPERLSRNLQHSELNCCATSRNQHKKVTRQFTILKIYNVVLHNVIHRLSHRNSFRGFKVTRRSSTFHLVPNIV